MVLVVEEFTLMEEMLHATSSCTTIIVQLDYLNLLNEFCQRTACVCVCVCDPTIATSCLFVTSQRLSGRYEHMRTLTVLSFRIIK